MTVALEAVALGKRYRKGWGLRDCSFSLPAGRVAALVGPNAAGKSTLLRIAAGLVRPTTGECRVLGRAPGAPDVLARVGYLDQERLLYRRFRVDEMLRFGRVANERWDDARAVAYLDSLGIDARSRVGDLSVGQQAQVALSLCLAKRPDLLLLDEPLANLDPLARQRAMQAVMTTVADDGTTVVYSSHVVSELEGVCDFLIVLGNSRVQLADDIDHVLSSHWTMVGPRSARREVPAVGAIVTAAQSGRSTNLLVRSETPTLDPSWQQNDASLEEIIVGYLTSPDEVASVGLQVLDGHRKG